MNLVPIAQELLTAEKKIPRLTAHFPSLTKEEVLHINNGNGLIYSLPN